jgi:hypothetical protein
MTKRLPIDIPAIEHYYRIEEDGAVYSYARERYLKAVPNSAGYLHVCLHLYMPHKFFLVHRLVSAKYNGECPPNKEACHDDGNKWNNHYTNIIYKSHGDNVTQSYREHGRTHIYIARTAPLSFQTKQLMAEAKNKPVIATQGIYKVTYPSIEIAAKELLSYRKKIYRCIKDGLEFVSKKNNQQGIFLYFAPKPTLSPA